MLNFPLSHIDFFSHYFEQKPLLCSAVMEKSVVGLQDIDALLDTLEPDERRLQMFLQGQVPPPQFLDEVFELGRHKHRINKDGFFNLLQQGATLVINQAEDTASIFKRLCAEIANFTGQTSSSNAYLSFGGKGTFGKHWDTHDVFAVQLIGKKHWQLFEPTLPLPLSHQSSAKFPQPPKTEPSFECTLSAGDLLYIPRGWWHNVTPFEVESLHLSIGTYPPTVLDYLMWICKTQLPQSLAARKTCPSQIKDPALTQAIEKFSKSVNQQQNLHAFNNSQRVNAQHSGEFQTALILNKNNIADNQLVSLNARIAADQNTHSIEINDMTLNINSTGRLLIGLLQLHGQLSWGELRELLGHIPGAALHQTAVDLSRYELLNIHTPRKFTH